MKPRRVGLIGFGAIAQAAVAAIERDPDCSNIEIAAVLLREGRRPSGALPKGCELVHSVIDLVELAPCGIFECASHEAVKTHGREVLEAGRDLSLISIGALTDCTLRGALRRSAIAAGARLSILPGAVPGVEALAAARMAGLERVVHTIRKPPESWRGTLAEHSLDLNLLDAATIIYEGSAHGAASQFPSNANSTAAIALAGLGFDDTRTLLIADPGIRQNIHQLEARGDFGTMTMEVQGYSLPDHPKTSTLAALSVARAMKLQCGAVSI